MKSPCTIAGEKGKCEECDYGTYTEHANGLEHCFKCTLCHSGNSADGFTLSIEMTVEGKSIFNLFKVLRA